MPLLPVLLLVLPGCTERPPPPPAPPPQPQAAELPLALPEAHAPRVGKPVGLAARDLVIRVTDAGALAFDLEKVRVLGIGMRGFSTRFRVRSNRRSTAVPGEVC